MRKSMLWLAFAGLALAGCDQEPAATTSLATIASFCPANPGWVGPQTPYWQCMDDRFEGSIPAGDQSLMDARAALAHKYDAGKLSLDDYKIQAAQIDAADANEDTQQQQLRYQKAQLLFGS